MFFRFCRSRRGRGRTSPPSFFTPSKPLRNSSPPPLIWISSLAPPNVTDFLLIGSNSWKPGACPPKRASSMPPNLRSSNFNRISLEDLGWGEPFKSAFEARAIPHELPARVVEERRGAYVVQSEAGEWPASISGRLRHAAARRIDFPTVGDWVAIKTRPKEVKATLQAILPRKSKLSRKASGKETDEQLIAANLDVVFVVTSLNKDFNARRLERYLSMVSDSGAAPVVLLSKADLFTGQKGSDSDLE